MAVTLAKRPDSVAATMRGLFPSEQEVVFPAGWEQKAWCGPPLAAPAGDRFLVQVLLPATVRVPAGTQLWLQYNLTRDRPEYLYFVAY